MGRQSMSVYIPHTKAIIACILGGVPIETIPEYISVPVVNEVFVEYGFNAVNMDGVSMLAEKLIDTYGLSSAVEYNRKIFPTNYVNFTCGLEKHLVDDSVFNIPYFENSQIAKLAKLLVHRVHRIPFDTKTVTKSIYKAYNMLFANNLRSLIEVGVLKDVSFDPLKKIANSVSFASDYSVSAPQIYLFTSMFWACDAKSLNRAGASLNDVWNYLNIDKHNVIYGQHKRLIFASRDAFIMNFGAFDDDQRLYIAKLINGKASSIILDCLDKNVPIRPCVLDVKRTSEGTIDIMTKENIDPDSYRKEIDRIYDRIEYVKTHRLAMNDIRNKVVSGDVPSESDEPDVPVFPNMKE